ncbi:hypothetical protein DC094_13250 [Pelagibaculum spongiae]|uniref:Uncharacterized protein n=1 Tax=Pelagibaculum spongiae TaxID=2080658 RepID=A0A2V1GZ34_9GAMM|nr:hypothetical protein DC094_13250 [Pelagibaculum spongiae]
MKVYALTVTKSPSLNVMPFVERASLTHLSELSALLFSTRLKTISCFFLRFAIILAIADNMLVLSHSNGQSAHSNMHSREFGD